jgi:dTMP kinase
LKGIFITLEGIEGAGKTTQVSALTANLIDLGYDVQVTREPGGCPIAQRIRTILLDPANAELAPLAELFLYLADRAQHVGQVIRPALEAGKVVLCDRYADATIAYQGFARGLGQKRVTDLNYEATDGLTPDLTILFDLPAEVGLGRAMARIEGLDAGVPPESRFEQEALDFHQKVRDGYLELARQFPDRFVIVNAEKSPDDLGRDIQSAVGKWIKARA